MMLIPIITEQAFSVAGTVQDHDFTTSPSCRYYYDSQFTEKKKETETDMK